MKSLYDKNFRWTSEASCISAEVGPTIYSVMKKYTKMGYSPREISHLIICDVMEAGICEVLSINYPEKK